MEIFTQKCIYMISSHQLFTLSEIIGNFAIFVVRFHHHHDYYRFRRRHDGINKHFIIIIITVYGEFSIYIFHKKRGIFLLTKRNKKIGFYNMRNEISIDFLC